MGSPMTTESRRDRLRELVQARGFAALGELAESLNVSESTVRRDLEQLESAGDAKRTHGGVFWTGKPATMRIFESRRDNQWPAKAAIGQVAAELIEDHDTILLDGGSTTYELARHLVGRPLQVVTMHGEREVRCSLAANVLYDDIDLDIRFGDRIEDRERNTGFVGYAEHGNFCFIAVEGNS